MSRLVVPADRTTTFHHKEETGLGKEIKVVGAVVVRDGRVLCAQRGPSGTLAGQWEFPGGKLEAGESPTEALVREIREELSCEISISSEVTTTSHEYEFGTVILTTYYSNLESGEPRVSEHARIEWRSVDKLGDLDWAPADIPAVAIIQRDLT
jgi:8-oxo-dGTP diphosphatase